MTHAIMLDEPGGPDVLKWRPIDDPVAGEGDLVVRHTAIGLNFIDTYFRTGGYKPPNGYPLVLGSEAAGIVEAVGPGVEGFAVGDRVAYGFALGAYCERRALKAESALKIPDGVDDKSAAAMMLKGMTVRYLLKETYKVEPSSVVLFHAASGGVGTIFGQWAKTIGATTIGTVGSAAKAELAKANGYTHVINYAEDDFVARVKEITGGKGCDVVYDAVGKDTYQGSLKCLKTRGLFANFGNSSGPIADFKMADLAKGSFFATRPGLGHHIATREALEANAADLFAMVASGAVKIPVDQTFALQDAAEAHRALEGRRTTGSTVLLP